MYSFYVHLLFSVCIFVYLYNDCEARTQWEATPISIDGHTTNPSAMDSNLRLERISRGEYGFSGTFFWGIDMDDSVMVEMRILNSYTGKEADYKLTPFSIQPQKFTDYINTFYKDLLIPNLGNCTDMPKYESGYVPPWPKTTFNFNHCTVSGEGLPEVLAEGFYRAEAIITALPTVSVNVSAVLRIKTKMF
ncbi:uncharacterized protein LOC108051351 [Drosophila rhopaloa]|uniref:Uncharacterized protein LOC108051351 n=1 Tax=Drosophila rhopaloa TaxID=1041015 RepID=A0A6P4FUT0_DRORH|nr:uncharacterized protein LOC108051351 [Drosophila rhopaloa]